MTGRAGIGRRRFLGTLGIGAGALAAGYALPAVVAETLGPDHPETNDPRLPAFWETDAGPFPEVPAVDADRQFDLAVIGSGITGISAASTALELEPDLRVCVIDSHRPCSGASTRFSTHLFGRAYGWKKILSSRGPDAARESLAFNDRVVERFVDRLTTHQIDCHLERKSFLQVGTAGQEERVRETFSQMTRVGLRGRLIESGELAERLKTSHYPIGIETYDRYYVHPGRMMKGLLARVLRQGASVFRDSPVMQVRNTDSDAETNILETPNGRIAARKVLFATNAYTPRMNGLLSSRMAPIVLATVATRPIEEGELRRLGVDFHAFIEVQRLSRSFGWTPDGRLFMRGILGYAAFNSCHWGGNGAQFERLEGEIRTILPWVGDFEITERWEGAVGMNISGLPMSGALRDKGQYASVCFNGNGVVDGFFTGRLVAHQMAAAHHPELGYLRSPYDSPALIPHEPHRTFGARVFFSGL